MSCEAGPFYGVPTHLLFSLRLLRVVADVPEGSLQPRNHGLDRPGLQGRERSRAWAAGICDGRRSAP
jgi:hypothetical protein